MCAPLDFEIDENIMRQISGINKHSKPIKASLKPLEFDLDENIIKKITANSSFERKVKIKKEQSKQVVNSGDQFIRKESSPLVLTKSESNFNNDYLSYKSTGPIIVTWWNFQE